MEHQSDWDIYFCEIDNRHAAINIDLAWGNKAPLEVYSNLLTLSIELKTTGDEGFPTEEELKLVNTYSLEVEKVLFKNIEGLLVGTIVTTGTFDMAYYFPPEHLDKAKNIIQEKMSSFDEYVYHVSIEEDEDWRFYFDVLYPSEEEYHLMKNRGAISRLAENGEDLSISRPISHWIHFQNADERALFIKEVEEKGFTVKDTEFKDFMPEYPFHLLIEREDNLEFESIDRLTLLLLEKCERRNARYYGWETISLL